MGKHGLSFGHRVTAGDPIEWLQISLKNFIMWYELFRVNRFRPNCKSANVRMIMTWKK